MKRLLFTFIFLIISLASSSLLAFNLSVNVTGGSGSWNDGVYEITGTQTLSFSCAPTGGTAPYTYEWRFPWMDGLKDRWKYGVSPRVYDDQNPSIQMSWPGLYTVEVKVTDDNSNVEWAFLRVEMLLVRSPVINMDTDATYGCDNTGVQDCTSNLRGALNSLTNGGVLEFPAGTYKIAGSQCDSWQNCFYNNQGEWYGFAVPYDKITFRPAIRGTAYTLNFDYGSNADDNAHQDIGFHVRDGAAQEWKFLIEGPVTLKWVTYTSRDADDVRMLAYNYFGGLDMHGVSIFQDANIVDWSNGIVGKGQYFRTNHEGHGTSNGSRQPSNQTKGQTIFYRVYADSEDRYVSHFNYAKPSGWYEFWIENWVNQENMSGWTLNGGLDKSCMENYGDPLAHTNIPLGEANNDLAHVYAIGNYFQGCSIAGIEIRNKNNPDDIHDIRINLNTFKNVGNGAGRDAIFFEGDTQSCSGWSNIEIDGNLFFRTSGFEYDGDGAFMHFGQTFGTSLRRFGPMTITNNEFGRGPTGSSPNNIDDNDFYVFRDGLTEKCSGTWTLTGNTNTTNIDTTADPGPWEFDPPVVYAGTVNGNTLLVVGTSGSGSGLGSTARWPLNNAASMYVIDSSGNRSELIDYSTSPNYTFSITPVEVVVVDVDGNHSDPFTLSQVNNVEISGAMISGGFIQ